MAARSRDVGGGDGVDRLLQAYKKEDDEDGMAIVRSAVEPHPLLVVPRLLLDGPMLAMMFRKMVPEMLVSYGSIHKKGTAPRGAMERIAEGRLRAAQNRGRK